MNDFITIKFFLKRNQMSSFFMILILHYFLFFDFLHSKKKIFIGKINSVAIKILIKKKKIHDCQSKVGV